MTKIVINDQEFLVISEPIKIFKKLYGADYHIIDLISKRFEKYKKSSIEVTEVQNLFNFLTSYIPMKYGFKQIYIYNILYLEYANSYRTYRHLFNLPVNGQRTWGGGKSIKNLKSQLYNYKLKKFSRFLGINQVLFTAEIVNLM